MDKFFSERTMIKFFAAAVALLAAIPSAQAGTISYTAPIGISWVGDPESINTSMPGFTASLGTLTGATYNVFGTGFETLTNNNPSQPWPAPVEANIIEQTQQIGEGGEGTIDGTPFSAFGTPTTISTGFGDDATFVVPTASLQSLYTNPVFNEYFIGFFATFTSGGAPVSGNQTLSFSGTLTETFTYTPVPEPGSAPLWGTAIGATVALGWLRRKKALLF